MAHHHYDTLFKKDPAIEKWAQYRAFEIPRYWKPTARGITVALIAYAVIPFCLYKVAMSDQKWVRLNKRD